MLVFIARPGASVKLVACMKVKEAVACGREATTSTPIWSWSSEIVMLE